VTKVLFLGPAREAAGRGRDEMSAGTVGELLARCVERYGPHFERVLAVSQIWLNAEETTLETAVGPYDEVAVVPPVSGG